MLMYSCIDIIYILEKIERVIRTERVCVSFLRNVKRELLCWVID